MKKSAARGLIQLIILLFAMGSYCACSLLRSTFSSGEKRQLTLGDYRYYDPKDYVDHLLYLGETYLKSPGIRTIPISENSKSYFESIFKKVVGNNELLFRNSESPFVTIIDNEMPFHFSLPNGRIFLSLGLIRRYVRHEGDLLAILIYESIKSYRNLYNLNIIIPIGFISTERLLSLTRISLSDKVRINKWTFFALKRSGHDPYFILNWLQQQNKNSLDFSLHLGDIKSISKEEFIIKTFILSSKIGHKISKMKKNSSREFYKFIHEIKAGSSNG